jgi:outer membrane receptor protein involved in Fe transport
MLDGMTSRFSAQTLKAPCTSVLKALDSRVRVDMNAALWKKILVAQAALGGQIAFACGTKVQFDIPAQMLDTALLKFAQDAKVAVVFPVGAYADVRVNGLQGTFCVETALDQLLEGVGVEGFIDETDQIVLRVSEDVERTESRKPRGVISSIAAFLAGSADAETATRAQRRQGEMEEIIVTGSRIRNTSGFTTPVPVTSVTVEELSDFAPGNTMSQQLSALPQFFSTRTLQDTGNPGPNRSASGLNLRNLGRNRTLVLLDGYRIAPTDKEGTVNVDVLPSTLFRGVDIVTGGTSAAYGADAVGGVVNFILDREFEGLKTRIGGGFNERASGGDQWEFEVAGGRSFLDGRLHLIGSLQSREISQIEGTGTVDNFRRIGHVTNPAWVANPQLRGTLGLPHRLTLPDVVSTLTTPTGLISAPGTPLDRMQFNMNGTDIVPFIEGDVVALPGLPGSTGSMSGGPEARLAYQAFNTSPAAAQAIARAGFFGVKFDLGDRLSFSLDGLVGRTEGNTQGSAAREGDTFYELGDPWNATVAVDNAFLPSHVRQTMIEYGLNEIKLNKLGSFMDRPTEGSNLRNHNVATQWQWGMGFDYELADPQWLLQGRWQRGESKRIVDTVNRIRADRLFLAMDAVRDPTTGAIVCRVQTVNPTVEQLRASPAIVGRDSKMPLDPYIPPGTPGNTKPLESPIGLDNTVRDCVPYNVMGSGNITPAALAYISSDKKGVGYVDQDFAELLLTGDLFELPAGPVNFAAGVTWRDQQFIDGAEAGRGVGVGGKVVTNEDLGPPLNDPALGIRGISPGYTGGSANLSLFITIPNIGGQTDVWEWYGEVNVPVLNTSVGGWEQQMALNLAYRESDYDRSGVARSWKVGLDYQFHLDWRLRFTDSQDVREPTFSELFDARGGGVNIRDPRFNGASFQVTAASGGNLNLASEEARTNTVGLVWQPRFASALEGLQASVDWWDTDITGQVSQLGAQRIVDECEFNGILCDQISRDSVTGIVTRVLNQFLNLEGAKATGIDLEVSWRTEPNLFVDEPESLTLRWLASHLSESSNTPLGGVPLDVAGELESPDYTHVFTANYGVGPWSVQLQNRFVDSTLYDTSWVEGIDVDDNTIASMSWWNARIGYQSTLASGAIWSVGLNIQNIFDQDPPVVPGFSSRGGTQEFSNTFDKFGRRYNLNATYNF